MFKDAIVIHAKTTQGAAWQCKVLTNDDLGHTPGDNWSNEQGT
jgi:hypothetical protein